MSSSSRINNRDTSDKSLQKLIAFKASCENYRFHLIDLMLRDSRIQTGNVRTIAHALNHERSIAGNLAGLLDIQWDAGVWTMGRTDFSEQLKEDVQAINDKLNAMSDKRNFSEDDLRIILHDVLISRLNSLIETYINEENIIHLIVQQYSVLSQIIKQLDKCIVSNEEVRETQLHELRSFIKEHEKLLANLTIAPARLSLLSKPKSFLAEANAVLGDIQLTMRNRAS